MFKCTSHRKQSIVILGLALSVVGILVCLLFATPIQYINNITNDIQLRLSPISSQEVSTVIVDVDNDTILNDGQWSWNNPNFKALVDRLYQAGATSVVFDGIVSERTTQNTEPNRNSNHNVAFVTLPPMVVANYFSQEKIPYQKNCIPHTTPIDFNDEGLGFQSITVAGDVICGGESEQHVFSGFENVYPSPDGVYRTAPMVIVWQDKLYPSLALQSYIIANHVKHIVLNATRLGGFELMLDAQRIRLSNDGTFIVRLLGKKDKIHHVSALDVLQGKAANQSFKHKTVFIGLATATNIDYRPTYLDPLFQSVDFQATVFNNIKYNQSITPLFNHYFTSVIAACLVSCLMCFLMAYGSIAVSILVPFLFNVTLFVVSRWCFKHFNVQIDILIFFMFINVVAFGMVSFHYMLSALRMLNLSKDVEKGQQAIIQSICSMSEYRDPETGAHIIRTQNYIEALAKYLQQRPKYKKILSDENIGLIYQAAPLHDIGKIGIRDNILLKEGKLTPEEFEVMKTHPSIGAQIIQKVSMRMGNSKFLAIAEDIVACHHEKWDGTGYPLGMNGDNIPIAARLMAVADVYDALISKRVYKPAYSHRKAMSIILKGRGHHFDPEVVDAFVSINKKFMNIALLHADSDELRHSLLAIDDDLEESMTSILSAAQASQHKDANQPKFLNE